MKNIAVYGAGGFGRETAWLIQEINQEQDQWNLLGFFDDGFTAGAIVDSLPVLGGMEAVNQWAEPMDLVVAIADPFIRRQLVSRITNRKISYPTVIHPKALRGSPTNSIGRGAIVTAGVILTTGIRIGDFTILNLAATIGHDVKLGDYTSVMPQTSISGGVTIGPNTLIGSGARILQGLSIGASSVVGAGAVVTKSCPDGSRLVGVPARHIPKRP